MAFQQRMSDESSPTTEVSGADRKRSVCDYQTPTRSASYRLQNFLYRHPKLHELWLESRSFYRRIELLCKKGAVYPIDMGQAWVKAPGGHLVWNTTSDTRIRDTQKLLADYPWMSGRDVLTFLRGWDAGLEYGAARHREPSDKKCS